MNTTPQTRLLSFPTQKLIYLSLLLIVLAALFLRINRLESIPPSLSWDEAANGYNAYAIANWGMDEWGNFLPIFFKSFEDDKHPVHIYFTALSVKFLGLSEFSTRLPTAAFGVLNVLVLFFLAKEIFSSRSVGLIASFFLAISPFALQFSRFSHEANFALFFFMLGFLLFLQALRSNPERILISFISFGIGLLTYHSAEVLIPPIIGLLIALNFQQLMRMKLYFFLGLILFSLFIYLVLANPALLGISRINQTSFSDSEVKNTTLYKQTNSLLLGRADITAQQYIKHFSWQFLFISGDKNSRHSVQAVGEFYKIDLIFLTVGLIGIVLKLLKKQNVKAVMVLLAWSLLAPIPSSLVNESPHAARALFMMGSWHLVSAYGMYTLIRIVKGKFLQIGVTTLFIGLVLGFFYGYLVYYYTSYGAREANEWQYGMKQITDFVKEHPEYRNVYMTDIRSQPYIFFLYYLKTSLPDFLDTVNYNETNSRPSNLVASYDRYFFANWDPIESMPNDGVLYIVGPSHYNGLRHKQQLSVKKQIVFPNGNDAFFLVSYP